MRKQIIIAALGIIMLTGVMAMYAGDTISFETNLTNPVYTVTENSSNLDGLNITFENSNITISPELNYKPDNFSLIFFDNITKEVIKVINNRGRSRTKYVDNNITVYVPEYINTTETVEVEKIVDRVEFQETGYGFYHILLGVVVGLILGLIIRRNLNIK